VVHEESACGVTLHGEFEAEARVEGGTEGVGDAVSVISWSKSGMKKSAATVATPVAKLPTRLRHCDRA
jgi:hypothetical protein